MISRIVDDHLLRPVVGALPYTELFAAPAPTSLIGEPGWVRHAPVLGFAAAFELHGLNIGSGDNEVAANDPHGERGHRLLLSIGST